jgi:DNA-binding transcriptional ArsR family regulator
MTSSSVSDVVFDALANAARRDIVVRLSRGGATTPDLGRDFHITKQALSRHLRVLEDAGLIERRLRGRVHELNLVPDQLEGVSKWASFVRENWAVNLDRLDSVLGGGDE